ncbi:DUF2017 domain-containing protein [Streptomyces sp. NPDC060194]|uniref:DUF2017 domain-containing protein n=1 Tax=Streptomyces sp. NPDC060194 TaxID=3347069 RepID=UPI003666D8F6
MPGLFEPAPEGPGAAVVLDAVEISILRSLGVQLLELIGPGESEDQDPFEALFNEGPSEPPADPALARLFPDAYGGPESSGDDEQLRSYAAEFRRFTEPDLRTRKREDALAVVRSLDALAVPGDDGVTVLTLDAEGSRSWLGTLNDLRLTVASRLDITDEDESGELYRLPDDDPRKPMVMAYLWLGGLQESLVDTLLV